ncbi:MAG: TetR/AcrR family transcriptional regulator [Candidatus Heimdallarchaeota archaeon]|nr:TetR/AcrR family transcriptional regulator [Candidatus Heimdallarchaeota archaeon]
MSKESILEISERLFMKRGYDGVSVKDITSECGLKKSSIYHHFPGGKEELYEQVVMHKMDRLHHGIIDAINEHKSIESQLESIFKFISNHPPIRMLNMMLVDMAQISKETAFSLSAYAREQVFQPITTLIQTAKDNGSIRDIAQAETVTGVIFAIADGLELAPGTQPEEKFSLMKEVLEMILFGLFPRKE